jgi:hypothetical protein
MHTPCKHGAVHHPAAILWCHRADHDLRLRQLVDAVCALWQLDDDGVVLVPLLVDDRIFVHAHTPVERTDDFVAVLIDEHEAAAEVLVRDGFVERDLGVRDRRGRRAHACACGVPAVPREHAVQRLDVIHGRAVPLRERQDEDKLAALARAVQDVPVRARR